MAYYGPSNWLLSRRRQVQWRGGVVICKLLGWLHGTALRLFFFFFFLSSNRPRDLLRSFQRVTGQEEASPVEGTLRCCL
jgi:hypothetical protein